MSCPQHLGCLLNGGAAETSAAHVATARPGLTAKPAAAQPRCPKEGWGHPAGRTWAWLGLGQGQQDLAEGAAGEVR